MIEMLATLAAAQMAPPVPVKPWIREEDYIQQVEAAGESASLIRVIVAPDGKPVACQVTWSSGSKRTDKLSCSLTLGRSRFEAARDGSGRPAWGEFQEVVNFYSPDGRKSDFPMQRRPDLSLTVGELPAGMARTVVKLAVAVDAEGRLTDCAGLPGSDERLAATACNQLGAAWKAEPATSPAGEAIGYVAARQVQFIAR